jgi:hypothetical protein
MRVTINGETIVGSEHEIIDWLNTVSNGQYRFISALSAKTDDEEALVRCLKACLGHYGNDPQDSFDGLKHMFQSLETIRTTPGINLLKDAFKDKPVVIALTGPSLNKQLPLLKEWQGLIICPDVSRKILQAERIEPHFICVLERYDLTTKAMTGDGNGYYVIMPVVKPAAYKAYGGPKLIAYRTIAHFDWLPFDRGKLESYGIVGNMCFSMAEHLGCNPIIIIGGDHAFTGGRTHAKGMEFGDQGHLIPTRMMCKGYYGGKVETEQTYWSALQELSRQIKNSGKTVYNCTEGGAYMDEAIHEPFKMVGRHNAPVDAFQIIADCLKDFTPDKVSWRALKRDSARRLQNIMNTCKKGLQGKATPQDVLNCEPEIFFRLVMHVIQPFHLTWCMKPDRVDVWFFVVRDCVRRIKKLVE